MATPSSSSSFACCEATFDPMNTRQFPRQSSNSQTSMPLLSDCSSSSSSANDDDCTLPAPAAFLGSAARTSLDLDSQEPLSFGGLSADPAGSSGFGAHGMSRFPSRSFPAPQQSGQFHMNPLQIRQHGRLLAVGTRDAASSFLQAEAAGGCQHDLSDDQFTQPLLWMSHKCHWTRDNAGVVAPPGRQQLELADYVTFPNTSRCLGSTSFGTHPRGAAEAASGLTARVISVESLPLEISRLLSQCSGYRRGDVGSCSDSHEVELQGSLQLSEHTCSILVDALLRKTRECDNLRAVVRDLTAIRARGAGVKLALQERCSHLVSDVARLQRAATAARRGQLASVQAMHSANAAKAEAELTAATLQQQQKLAAFDAHSAAAGIGPQYGTSVHRLVSSASVRMAGSHHQDHIVPRFGVSC